MTDIIDTTKKKIYFRIPYIIKTIFCFVFNFFALLQCLFTDE